ncbi:MAG: HAMP domain-containing protein, partial [Phaeodactylibacter sp.]|nr:HAMP domain-containing protein [Phaeodactylibacter sp.]
EINTLVNTIFHLNQDAIEQRNQTAGKTADEVFLYMIIFGAGGIIIGLLVTLGMPSVISRPVDALDEAISQVARGRYDIEVPIITENELGRLARSFNKMARKLQEYEESNYARILFEKKRLDAVINQFNGAVIGLDESKAIIFVNERALSLIGMERDKLIGRYAPEIAQVNPLMQKLTSRLMIGFDYWEKEAYGPIKITEDRQEKLFSQEAIHISLKPTGEDRSVLIGHVIILTDITEFAEKDRAKTRFIATLSHELKTPVAAIDMAASLLENKKTGGLNDGQRECLSTIRGNNRRIQRIINEILDLSKIESGSIEVINEKTSADKLIDKAVTGVIPFLEDKHIEIKVSQAGSVPWVLADPQKTIWVLNNFLTNAIRYSPAGGLIKVTAVENEFDVTLSVKDNGKGIGPELKERLFQPYARSKDDKTEGAGLGLAISKEFIEAMGGSIGVQSEPGNGAEFWIKLRKARD